MSLFDKWVHESEKAIEPLMNRAIKGHKGLVPEGYEEKLIQQYLTFKIVRVTWIAILITALISLLSTIINLIT